jgi:NTE family protein
LAILTKAAGVPVDRYANESVELLRDIDARWAGLRQMRDSVAFAKDRDPQLAYVVNAPDADIYTIDISFQALTDQSEREFLNQLPTAFALPAEAVDRLRAAAARLVFESADLRAALKDAGVRFHDQAMPAPLITPNK